MDGVRCCLRRKSDGRWWRDIEKVRLRYKQVPRLYRVNTTIIKDIIIVSHCVSINHYLLFASPSLVILVQDVVLCPPPIRHPAPSHLSPRHEHSLVHYLNPIHPRISFSNSRNSAMALPVPRCTSPCYFTLGIQPCLVRHHDIRFLYETGTYGKGDHHLRR